MSYVSLSIAFLLVDSECIRFVPLEALVTKHYVNRTHKFIPMRVDGVIKSIKDGHNLPGIHRVNTGQSKITSSVTGPMRRSVLKNVINVKNKKGDKQIRVPMLENS